MRERGGRDRKEGGEIGKGGERGERWGPEREGETEKEGGGDGRRRQRRGRERRVCVHVWMHARMRLSARVSA